MVNKEKEIYYAIKMKGFENMTFKKALDLTYIDIIVGGMSALVSFEPLNNPIFVIILIVSLISPIFFKHKFSDFSYIKLMAFKMLMHIILVSMIIASFLELDSFLEISILIFIELFFAGFSLMFIKYSISKVNLEKEFPKPNVKLFASISGFTFILVYSVLHNKAIEISSSTLEQILFYSISIFLVVFIYSFICHVVRVYLYLKHKI